MGVPQAWAESLHSDKGLAKERIPSRAVSFASVSREASSTASKEPLRNSNSNATNDPTAKLGIAKAKVRPQSANVLDKKTIVEQLKPKGAPIPTRVSTPELKSDAPNIASVTSSFRSVAPTPSFGAKSSTAKPPVDLKKSAAAAAAAKKKPSKWAVVRSNMYDLGRKVRGKDTAADEAETMETVQFYSPSFQRFWKRAASAEGLSPRSQRLSLQIPLPLEAGGAVFALWGVQRPRPAATEATRRARLLVTQALPFYFRMLPPGKVLDAISDLFRTFDQLHCGAVDAQRLSLGFQKLGKPITAEEASLILVTYHSHDPADGPDNGITREEFEDMILKSLRLPAILRPDRCHPPPRPCRPHTAGPAPPADRRPHTAGPAAPPADRRPPAHHLRLV